MWLQLSPSNYNCVNVIVHKQNQFIILIEICTFDCVCVLRAYVCVREHVCEICRAKFTVSYMYACCTSNFRFLYTFSCGFVIHFRLWYQPYFFVSAGLNVVDVIFSACIDCALYAVCLYVGLNYHSIGELKIIYSTRA